MKGIQMNAHLFPTYKKVWIFLWTDSVLTICNHPLELENIPGCVFSLQKKFTGRLKLMPADRDKSKYYNSLACHGPYDKNRVDSNRNQNTRVTSGFLFFQWIYNMEKRLWRTTMNLQHESWQKRQWRTTFPGNPKGELIGLTTSIQFQFILLPCNSSILCCHFLRSHFWGCYLRNGGRL